MPKTGLSPAQWKQRLRSYARGEYSFGRGQKPPRESQWAKELAKIETCPQHRAAGMDVFGRQVGCKCGYHSQQQSTTEGSAAASPLSSSVSITEGTAVSPLSSFVSMTEGTAVSPLSSFVSVTEGTAVSPLSSSVSVTEGTAVSPLSSSVSRQQSKTDGTTVTPATKIGQQSTAIVATTSKRVQNPPRRVVLLPPEVTFEPPSRAKPRKEFIPNYKVARRKRPVTPPTSVATPSKKLRSPSKLPTGSLVPQLSVGSLQVTASSSQVTTTSQAPNASLVSAGLPMLLPASHSSPHASLHSTSPQAPLATTSPQVLLATTSSQVSLVTTSPQVSLATTSPPVSLATTSPQVSLVTTNSPQVPAGHASSSPSSRAKEYPNRVPLGWERNMTLTDRGWIGRDMFIKRGELRSLKNWWHPPAIPEMTKPDPALYHRQSLFLWAPRLMWKVNFSCPQCDQKSMCGKGLYNRICLVLDLKGYYYLAGEYMYCSLCGGTFIAWDQRMLDQLSDGQRSKFPAVLTRKYACDRSVVSLLRARTLGNSSTAVANNVHELHTNEWLLRHTAYLSDCERHKKNLESFNLPIPRYDEASLPPKFPTPRWFASVLVRDIMDRMPELLAAATSIYGTVLKIDSTKKITKKLQGAAANTAALATNVGNEKGEIVVSVLTSSEDLSSLKPLADGLVRRYARAEMEPPLVMYTDRDCCSEHGPSRLKRLFNAWEHMEIRLDIWHFMRRIALACTTESHPLYGTLMAGVSNAIFEWDQQDFERLLQAKRDVLISSGLANPSDSAVQKTISREEAALHCRRTTRGVDKTVQMLENLFLTFTPATDTLGVPLLKDELTKIWEEQRRHIPCLQDPPGIPLYTITEYANKGGYGFQCFGVLEAPHH